MERLEARQGDAEDDTILYGLQTASQSIPQSGDWAERLQVKNPRHPRPDHVILDGSSLLSAIWPSRRHDYFHVRLPTSNSALPDTCFFRQLYCPSWSLNQDAPVAPPGNRNRLQHGNLEMHVKISLPGCCNQARITTPTSSLTA